MSLIRAFIAAEIPNTIQTAIVAQTSRLRNTLGDNLIRWIPSQNLHLTLKFLGDIAGSHLDFLKQAIAQTAGASPAFDLQLSGFGSFPNLKLPRILWVGLHAPASLLSLQRSIESAVVKLGYKKEDRAFSPHLTIGRVRQNLSPAELQKIRTALESFQLGNIGTARVNSIHLFKSDLNPNGAEYTKLFSAGLQ
jgi:2'-5' RNA ligase